jgi:hypothetical protein
MKAVLTSDWHLDWTTNGKRREAEILAAVERSVSVAIDERADLYAFCGDLCNPDGWNVLAASAYAIRFAARLAKACIPSLWLAGNHDVVEDGRGTTTLTPLLAYAEHEPLVTVANRPLVLDLMATAGASVVALPYVARSMNYDPAVSVRTIAAGMSKPAKQKCLVLGHLSLPNQHPGSETTDMARGRDVPWPLEELGRHLPQAVLVGGHYHRAGDASGVLIVGAPARLTHGEEDYTPSLTVLEL